MESQNSQPKPMMDVAPPKAPTPIAPAPEHPAKPTPDPAPKPVAPASLSAQAQPAGPQTLKVHAAPARDEADAASEAAQKPVADLQKHEQAKAATSAKASHPVREIVVLTILVMVILCGLAVLVYINA